MRYFFILLFANQFWPVQGQETEITAGIQGTWWLNTVQVENFAYNSTDQIMCGVSPEHALIITEDSVFFKSPETRFYKDPTIGFTYSITYDSLFNSQILNLFTGKGKRKKTANSYNFRLVNGFFILSSSFAPDANFNMLTQTNYYTYSRFKDGDNSYEKISGVWTTNKDRFVNPESSDTIYYTRKSAIQNEFTDIEILFEIVHGEPRMSYEFMYSQRLDTSEIYVLLYAVSNAFVNIRPDKKELIINNQGMKTVYQIIELTGERMTLLRHTD